MAGAPKGNTNAAKENRLITNALRRVVTQNPDKLRKACEKVLEDAMDGNLHAFTVIADRLDGKPAQTNVLQGDSEHPLVTRIERHIVNAANKDS